MLSNSLPFCFWLTTSLYNPSPTYRLMFPLWICLFWIQFFPDSSLSTYLCLLTTLFNGTSISVLNPSLLNQGTDTQCADDDSDSDS
jgi:hypothetical protein